MCDSAQFATLNQQGELLKSIICFTSNDNTMKPFANIFIAGKKTRKVYFLFLKPLNNEQKNTVNL